MNSVRRPKYLQPSYAIAQARLGCVCLLLKGLAGRALDLDVSINLLLSDNKRRSVARVCQLLAVALNYETSAVLPPDDVHGAPSWLKATV